MQRTEGMAILMKRITMLKRFIALSLVFAFVLLAASCESPPHEVPEPSVPNEVASPSVTITAPSSPVETPVVTATPSAPPPSGPVSVVLPNGPLPDESYTNAATQPPKRYYAEPMLGLVASDTYGRIVPYIGGTIVFHYDDEMSNLYGLCDLSGRIICDPVYNTVWIISDGETSLYALKVNKVSLVEIKEDGDTYYSYVENSTIKICPLDGSWTQTYESVHSMIYTSYTSIISDYIAAKKNDKWGVIGYNGDVILPFQYISPVYFSEGLACVPSDDGKTIWYIDSTGEQILGPYDMTPPITDWYSAMGSPPYPLRNFIFYNGYAPFCQDGKQGVIDKTGQVIIPAEYDRVQILEYGMVGYEIDGNWGLMTDAGKVIMELTSNGWFYFDGEGLFFYNDDTGEHIEILPDGTTLPFVISTFDRTTIEINGKKILLPESSYNYPWVTPLPNGTYLVEYYLDTYMSARWRIYDKNANPVSDEVLGYVEYIDLDGTGILLSSYYWSQIRIYDLAGNLIITDIFRDIDPIGSYLMVRTSDHGGVIDAKGNWIIKVPLFDYFPD